MGNKAVGIVDYQMGNLHSVSRALEKVGAETQIVKTPSEIAQCSHLVLPGVGQFGDAIERLTESGFVEPLKEYIQSKKPFFGICLGYQMLFDSSEEAPDKKGLGIYRGTVTKFPDNIENRKLIVPSIGWNRVNPTENGQSVLFQGITSDSNSGDYYYFDHSYYVPLESNESAGNIAAVTEYGIEYACALADGSVFGTQFHPEKSSDKGLQILENFVNID